MPPHRLLAAQRMPAPEHTVWKSGTKTGGGTFGDNLHGFCAMMSWWSFLPVLKLLSVTNLSLVFAWMPANYDHAILGWSDELVVMQITGTSGHLSFRTCQCKDAMLEALLAFVDHFAAGSISNHQSL